MSEDRDGLGGHRTDRPEAARYATARECGQLVFFAGISGRSADGIIPGVQDTRAGKTYDVDEQARCAFENLSAALGERGLDRSNVVDVTCYLVDMADYAVLVQNWNRFFTEDPPPRTTVAVHQLPDPDLRIELKAVAHRTMPA
ncbi:MAG TPA: RidA family protein [Ilumatobacteraceae bacterium]|nr:RidA family protein [Ilumatobacteraceae bacterium]